VNLKYVGVKVENDFEIEYTVCSDSYDEQEFFNSRIYDRKRYDDVVTLAFADRLGLTLEQYQKTDEIFFVLDYFAKSEVGDPNVDDMEIEIQAQLTIQSGMFIDVRLRTSVSSFTSFPSTAPHITGPQVRVTATRVVTERVLDSEEALIMNKVECAYDVDESEITVNAHYYVDGSISVTLEGMHGYIYHWRDYFISDMKIALASALDVHPKHLSVSFEGAYGIQFRIFASTYDSLMSLIAKMHSANFDDKLLQPAIWVNNPEVDIVSQTSISSAVHYEANYVVTVDGEDETANESVRSSLSNHGYDVRTEYDLITSAPTNTPTFNPSPAPSSTVPTRPPYLDGFATTYVYVKDPVTEPVEEDTIPLDPNALLYCVDGMAYFDVNVYAYGFLEQFEQALTSYLDIHRKYVSLTDTKEGVSWTLCADIYRKADNIHEDVTYGTFIPDMNDLLQGYVLVSVEVYNIYAKVEIIVYGDKPVVSLTGGWAQMSSEVILRTYPPTAAKTPTIAPTGWPCVNAEGWTNGFGMTCDDYASQGFCIGDLSVDFFLGQMYNYPERYCCICGGTSYFEPLPQITDEEYEVALEELDTCIDDSLIEVDTKVIDAAFEQCEDFNGQKYIDFVNDMLESLDEIERMLLTEFNKIFQDIDHSPNANQFSFTRELDARDQECITFGDVSRRILSAVPSVAECRLFCSYDGECKAFGYSPDKICTIYRAPPEASAPSAGSYCYWKQNAPSRAPTTPPTDPQELCTCMPTQAPTPVVTTARPSTTPLGIGSYVELTLIGERPVELSEILEEFSDISQSDALASTIGVTHKYRVSGGLLFERNPPFALLCEEKFEQFVEENLGEPFGLHQKHIHVEIDYESGEGLWYMDFDDNSDRDVIVFDPSFWDDLASEISTEYPGVVMRGGEPVYEQPISIYDTDLVTVATYVHGTSDILHDGDLPGFEVHYEELRVTLEPTLLPTQQQITFDDSLSPSKSPLNSPSPVPVVAGPTNIVTITQSSSDSFTDSELDSMLEAVASGCSVLLGTDTSLTYVANLVIQYTLDAYINIGHFVDTLSAALEMQNGIDNVKLTFIDHTTITFDAESASGDGLFAVGIDDVFIVDFVRGNGFSDFEMQSFVISDQVETRISTPAFVKASVNYESTGGIYYKTSNMLRGVDMESFIELVYDTTFEFLHLSHRAQLDLTESSNGKLAYVLSSDVAERLVELTEILDSKEFEFSSLKSV